MGKKVIAGIDIGGTNTRIGLADDEGNILLDTCVEMEKYKNNPNLTYHDYVKEIHEGIQSLLKGGGSKPYVLIGIGIGAPSGNYRTGCLENPVNLPWKLVPLTSELSKYYPELPIKLNNDANAAIIAEMVYGDAKGKRDFIVVTLGTGLGSGFVANGELIYGHDGLAGELGHIIAVENGRQCNCGRRGCVETYVSATGIKRTVFELLCDSPEKYDYNVNNNEESNKDYVSPLRSVPYNKLSGKDIDKAAREGDSVAMKAFEVTGRHLGKCLADMVGITSPTHIFLFGGLAEARELIFNPTIESLKKNVLFLYKKKDPVTNEYTDPKVEVVPSGLGNQNTGLLGAAALVWKDIN